MKRKTSKFLHSTLFLLVLTLASGLQATIFESDDIRDLIPHIDQNTLVIFDIDDTVAQMPQDLGNDTWFYSEAKQLMEDGKSFDDAAQIILPLFFLIHFFSPLEPVNEEIIQLIAELQQRDINVIALTARSRPLAERTKQELNRLGVYFSVSSPYDNDLDLAITHAGKYSGGIIFCANNNKGKITTL